MRDPQVFASNKRFGFRNGRLITGRTGESSVAKRSAFSAEGSNDRQAAVASMLSGFGSELVGDSNASMSMTLTGPMANQYMMTGLIPEQEDLLRRYYRDIYYYDSVAGSCCDLISMFPFSDWSLTGADSKLLEKFQESLARLNIRALMPEISLAYLVDSEFVGSLIFNKKDKVFIDLLIHSADECNIKPLPFYSSEPIVHVRNSKVLQEFMGSNDREARAVKALLPEQLIHALSAPAMKLDPFLTLYIARRTLPGILPTSFLKRVLVPYLLEKQLYRGTLVEAVKRQRAMLHIQMGDGDWEPTPQEMQDTVNQFQLADLDPLGAVLATRNGVTATEVRQGGDFWKWTDVSDTLVPIKLRALGISEAFLSSDANYSNSETAMSVFMENLDSYRAFMTYKVFTNKVFPIVAIANEFYKEGKKQDVDNRAKMMYQANNYKDLVIPTVRWHKPLAAKNEDNMMDLLNTLSEKGFPIPMRMWAAAGKIDLNSLYQDLEQDKAIKAKLKELTGEDPDTMGKADQEDGNMDDGGESDGDLEESSLSKAMGKRFPRRPLLSRTFGEDTDLITGTTKTGKKKHIISQRRASAEVNQTIAKAMRALNDPNIRRSALRRVAASLGRVPSLMEELQPIVDSRAQRREE